MTANPYRIMDYPTSPMEAEPVKGKPRKSPLKGRCTGHKSGYFLDSESQDDWHMTVICEGEICGLDPSAD